MTINLFHLSIIHQIVTASSHHISRSHPPQVTSLALTSSHTM